MRTFDLIFDGTNPIRMVITHKFFLILNDGGSAVDISVRKSSGFNDVKGVQAGFGFRLAEESRGQEFIFNSSVAQTIKIFVGDDEAMYNRLSGTVTINGGTLAQLTSILNVVKTVEDGIENYGAYKSTTAMGNAGADTIFTAAANVNGAVLYLATFLSAQSGGVVSCGYVAKATAPTSITDGDLIPLDYKVQTAGTYQSSGSLLKAVKIAAGKGLYYFTTLGDTNPLRSALYKLL